MHNSIECAGPSWCGGSNSTVQGECTLLYAPCTWHELTLAGMPVQIV